MMLSCITAALIFAGAPVDAALDAAIAQLIAPRTSRVHTIEYRSVPHELMRIDPRSSVRIAGEPKAWYRGAVDLPVEVTAPGGRRMMYYVGLRVRTFDSAAVAEMMIDRHAALARAPIAIRRIETTELADEPVRSGIEEMRSRQIIGAGRPITRTMIEPLPCAAAGASVNVLVVKENVRVSLTGRVREDGWKGSIVAVEIGLSKRLVRARVVDRMNVEVVE